MGPESSGSCSLLRQGDHGKGGGAGKGVAGGVLLASGGLDAGNVSRTWTFAGLSQVCRDTTQCGVYPNTELFQVLQPGQLRDRDTAGSVVLLAMVSWWEVEAGPEPGAVGLMQAD